MDYQQFLKSKICISEPIGFDIDINELSGFLLPHQKDAVKWAIKGGKRALFESFGLGKTLQQLEILRLIIKYEGGKGLIVCPLGVKQEFYKDAKKFYNIELEYITHLQEAKDSNNTIFITNYERVREGDIDPKYFTVTSLDEASCLRSSGSKTYHTFLAKFAECKYKFICTATPSPNDYIELINYSAYLGIMDKSQAKTRFFKRDSTKADQLTLIDHKEKDFWYFVSTWALFITKPSDLGYSDKGYDLPPLNIIYHCLKVDHSTAGADKYGQYQLLKLAAKGLKESAKEKRESMEVRINKMAEIINDNPDKHYIIWHDLEKERELIKKTVKDVKDVYGSQDLDIREQRTIDFSEGKIKHLATKPVISGSGCNFQYHCSDAIYLGIGFKFNDFIQSIHRIYRFMQNQEVTIHIIYTEAEEEVLKTLLKKWNNHNKMVENMTNIIKENGLSIADENIKMSRSMGCKRIEEKGQLFTAINNDAVLEVEAMQDDSVDLIHTSLPFSIQYEYSPSYNDFGHNENNEMFFEQMKYLIPGLLRVLKPGRICAVHVKDRIEFGNFTGNGFPTVYPFSDDTTKAFTELGFKFCGRITIVTDVVRENNQTYRLGWSENAKDGTKMSVGLSEYVLIFRKLPTDTSNAYADIPVQKSKEQYTRAQWQIDAHGFWRSSGNRFLTSDEMKNLDKAQIQRYFKSWQQNRIYNYEKHVEISKQLEECDKLPSDFMLVAPISNDDDVWHDVTRIRTLNTAQSQRNKNMHLCPLQFDIIDRIINRYSNKGEMVFDPFGGIMSVPYRAIKLGRKAIATELNYEYFIDGITYLREIESNVVSPTLFELEEIETK